VLRDDFLMRQIRQLARFLAALLGLGKEGKFDEALTELQRAYGTYVGMSRSMIDRLDAASVVTVLGRDRARMALALLEAEVAILTARGQDSRAGLVRAAQLRDALGMGRDEPVLDPPEH